MKTLLKGNHVQIEKVRALRSKFSYTVVMMNIKLLAVVTPPSIYQILSPFNLLYPVTIPVLNLRA